MRTIVALLTTLLCAPAQAQRLITELGGGLKVSQGSSYLMMPDCKKAMVVDPLWPENPHPPPQVFSCGGDNPVFVGWVLAWEFPSGIKLGYFHQSQWLDREGEMKFNCLCASGTIDWTRRWRNR